MTTPAATTSTSPPTSNNIAQAQPAGQPPAGAAAVFGAGGWEGIGIYICRPSARQHSPEFERSVGKINAKFPVVAELPASGWLHARNQQRGGETPHTHPHQPRSRRSQKPRDKRSAEISQRGPCARVQGGDRGQTSIAIRKKKEEACALQARRRFFFLFLTSRPVVKNTHITLYRPVPSRETVRTVPSRRGRNCRGT